MGFRRVMLVGLVLVLLAIVGCTEDNQTEPIPIPDTHPAYAFYQIVKRGPATLAVCESYGGREIYPNDYEIQEHIAQGMFTLREKSTDKTYLGISFGEGTFLVTISTCCWELDT